MTASERKTAAFDVLITEEMIDSFASLSGDRNPIHVSKEYAQSKKYPHRIAHGMLLGCFVSTLIGEHLPGGDVLILQTKIDFHKTVHPGDKLAILGSIESESVATNTLVVKFQISRGNDVVSKGQVLAQKQK